MPEIKSVWVQTAAPRLPEFPGAGEQGFYFVADGLLTMCDERGKSVAKPYRLNDGDNPHTIAGRLRLEAWRKAGGENDFNRPIIFNNAGIV
jgi:hypothetical protein